MAYSNLFRIKCSSYYNFNSTYDLARNKQTVNGEPLVDDKWLSSQQTYFSHYFPESIEKNSTLLSAVSISHISKWWNDLNWKPASETRAQRDRIIIFHSNIQHTTSLLCDRTQTNVKLFFFSFHFISTKHKTYKTHAGTLRYFLSLIHSFYRFIVMYRHEPAVRDR